MKSANFLVVALLGAFGAAQAQMSASMPMAMPMKASASAGQASVALTDGVVQRIDAKQGVVTLKHENITNMGMPAMTMGFGVADKKMLSGVKVGDKVRFHVEMVKGAPTITRIDAAR